MNKTKNVKILGLVLLMSALLMVAGTGVKAQSTSEVYVYVTIGGSVTGNGSTLSGANTYNYTAGTTVTFNAVPGTGFEFLGWEYASSSGAQVNTTNPFQWTLSSGSCALQAMFLPTTNLTSTAVSGSGSATIVIEDSIGGTTVPTAGSTTGTIGTSTTYTQTPGSGFKFLYWLRSSASGTTSYTDSSLTFTPSTDECAVQAFWVPTSSTLSVTPTTSPTPTVTPTPTPEYSSAIIVAIVAALVAVAAATVVYRKNRK